MTKRNFRKKDWYDPSLYRQRRVSSSYVVDTTPNVVLQVKTVESDGYNAVQLGFDDKRKVLSNKPEQGHVAKANTNPKRFIHEVRDVALDELKVEIQLVLTYSLQVISLTSLVLPRDMVSKVMSKDGQHIGPMAHGSRYHRRPGSLGAIINRVFPGKKLPGRMGNNTRTIQNLEIVKADTENNVLLIKEMSLDQRAHS